MRYDLARMAGPRRRKRVVLRPIEPAPALAEPLRAIGNEVVTGIRETIIEQLLPAYAPRPAVTTDSFDQIAAMLGAVKEKGTRLVSTISGRLSEWALRVEGWHRIRFAAAIKSGLGVDVIAFLTSAEAQDQTQAATAWAASLITNVADDLLQTVENRVWTAYAAGTPRQELGKQLADDLAISRKRADRIAIDQTTKLASNLDQMRQLEAGITTYEWRHSRKKHPRKHHVASDGKTFRWDTPPDDGHPGQAPFCGCRAMPVLELD